MRVCFPIEKDEGLSSRIYGHFGSSPMFLLVDTKSRESNVVVNTDSHHSHSACKPMRALKGERIDSIVVGNIGAGARMQLRQAGLRVFRATSHIVSENLDKITLDTLPEFGDDEYCNGQGSGGGRGYGNVCCH